MNDYTPEGKRSVLPSLKMQQAVVRDEVEPERDRIDRKDDIQARRRRRSDLGDSRNLKLHIPESLKDPEFTYRWINDRAGRVRQMTVEDDWDVVDISKLGADPDPDRNISEGTVLNRVGDKATGERMVLVRKRKEFYESDRKERYERLNRLEDTMRQKAPPDQQGLSDADNAYVPGGKNVIGR